MTDPGPRSPLPRISPLRHWGPLAVVVVLLIGVGVVATTSPSTTSTASSTSNGQGTTKSAQQVARSWSSLPELPVSYADAKAKGTTGDYDWGSRCDPSTGRLKIPSVYAPPCVPVWNGSKPWKDRGGQTLSTNGGATAPGVTGDTIKVVYYVPGPGDIETLAQTLGVLDPVDVMERTFQQFVEASNHIYELYGRKVVVERFQGSGNGIDPTTARADAIKVATQLHAFASIGGPSQTPAYADELAARHVLCISCGYAVPDANYQKDAPYQWGTLPTPEQFVYSAFDFGTRTLWGRDARFAGDPKFQHEKRRFGILYYDQQPPIFTSLRNQVLAHYKKQGYDADLVLSYNFNLDTLNTQAQTVIGKLKASGITTVVFLGDPLMLMYLTQQATKQNYFPEWTITGTVFTDATATGRLYDQKQWAHAFGVSSLPARTEPDQSDEWLLYKWYFGTDPEAAKTIRVLVPMAQLLYTGIQGAGPHLTAQTFAGGMFNFPPSGGGPLEPRFSFGFHGLFPNADYVAVDDYTVVWWDAAAVGPDEQGKQGKGMWAYVNGGKRYLLGSVPKGASESQLFNPKGAVTIYQQRPPGDELPIYPPWPGSPAAAAEKPGG